LTTVLRSVSWFGMLGYFGAFMGDHLGLDTQLIGVTYMLSGTAYLIGSLVASKVLALASPRLLIAGTNITLGISIGLIFGAADGAIGAMALLTLAGFLGALSNIGTVTVLSLEAPGGSGTIMVLNAALTNLGAAGGGALGGILLAFGGYPLLGIGLAAFALSTVALLIRRGAPNPTETTLQTA
ncbi:MAG: hypothetical protein M3173_04035, partial [Chloroflexota bacterium]|nr:hypothetical protein [Chloroflexota bacterium]